MDNTIKKYLNDILLAIGEIEGFQGDGPKLFDDFFSNLCLSVLLKGIIIGEAMNRILKVESAIQITNSGKIVDAGNYIIHGYDGLSADILRSMVVNHLPGLKLEVEKFIGTIKRMPCEHPFVLYIKFTNQTYRSVNEFPEFAEYGKLISFVIPVTTANDLSINTEIF